MCTDRTAGDAAGTADKSLHVFYLLYFDPISRFDVEKECERIDGNVINNDPPAIINKAPANLKTEVEASCNVFCVTPLILVLSVRSCVCV